MHIFGILLILAILFVWLYVAAVHFVSAQKKVGWKKLPVWVASSFVIVGATGFLGNALSAGGGLDWLPESFQWPVGSANGVISTADHFFVVPLPASGRVQVYDKNWKYIRGWRVPACGGTFRIFASDGELVHIVTARGQWHYVFDLHGKLLSTVKYATNAYDSFPNEGVSYVIPTPPWLWVFTSPFYSWLVAAIGVALLAVSSPRPNKSNK